MAKTTATSTKKSVSKKAQAIKIVARMQGRKKPATRGQIIDELVTKVGLSVNGAATYFQNINAKKDGWS